MKDKKKNSKKEVPFTEKDFTKALEKVISTPKKEVDDKLRAEKKQRGEGN